MNVSVKNVKFGDCSVITNNKDVLIIDCGSSNCGFSKEPSHEFAYSKIHAILHEKDVSRKLLISHFDIDHFNGILDVPDRKLFDEVFLPCSIVKDEPAFGSSIARLLAVAPDRSWGLRLSRAIIELFQKIEKITDKVTFLKRGNTVCVLGGSLNILWPDVVSSELSKLPTKLIENEFTWASSFNEYARIEEQLSKNFDHFFKMENFPEKQYESFLRILRQYLIALHEYPTDKPEVRELWEAAKALDDAREGFRNTLNEEALVKTKAFARQQYHALITEVNGTSVVCEMADKFIYLGDAPAKIVDHLFDLGDFKGKTYKVLKVQHHATQAYYTAKVPDADFKIISNGGYQNRKIGEDFITYHLKGTIACSNAHTKSLSYCESGCCKKCTIKIRDEENIVI